MQTKSASGFSVSVLQGTYIARWFTLNLETLKMSNIGRLPCLKRTIDNKYYSKIRSVMDEYG